MSYASITPAQSPKIVTDWRSLNDDDLSAKTQYPWQYSIDGKHHLFQLKF